MNSFLNQCELDQIGLKSCGTNVKISRKASIYGAENITLGNNIRIDDFCILSGNVIIEDYVHIAAYSALFGGQAGIVIEKFANISSRVCVYAVSDDYSGETMTNPMVSDKYKNIQNAPTRIGRHVIIGSGSTVLHGVTIGEGAAVGAMALVNESLSSWGIYIGIPCKRYKERSKNLLILERDMMGNLKRGKGTKATMIGMISGGGGRLLSSLSFNRNTILYGGITA